MYLLSLGMSVVFSELTSPFVDALFVTAVCILIYKDMDISVQSVLMIPCNNC
jgi:hypothetical protein